MIQFTVTLSGPNPKDGTRLANRGRITPTSSVITFKCLYKYIHLPFLFPLECWLRKQELPKKPNISFFLFITFFSPFFKIPKLWPGLEAKQKGILSGFEVMYLSSFTRTGLISFNISCPPTVIHMAERERVWLKDFQMLASFCTDMYIFFLLSFTTVNNKYSLVLIFILFFAEAFSSCPKSFVCNCLTACFSVCHQIWSL